MGGTLRIPMPKTFHHESKDGLKARKTDIIHILRQHVAWFVEVFCISARAAYYGRLTALSAFICSTRC